MKKLTIIIFILTGFSFFLCGQRANVFATYQLIENEKYAEAKKVIEEALENDKTWKSYKTWYARGLLCQKAYEKGIKNKDKKLYELYPDQLFVSYESFEKSLSYKRNSRITEQLEPIYIKLANDFIVMAEKEYKAKRYDKSLRAYENALEINESSILSVQLDTSLLYNTALAAYNSNDYKKSIIHLNRLNHLGYSPNIPHLLSTIYLSQKDTVSAETVLVEGIENYKESEELVLVLTDLLYKSNKYEKAIEVLDSAAIKSPEKFIYPYTKGMVYQKKEMYKEAIEAYKEAIDVDPEKLNSYTSIGTCYFNIGVEKEENARSINNNQSYREELARSESARKKAVLWLEKALDKDPDNEVIQNQLIQLYRSLHMTEKIKELQP